MLLKDYWFRELYLGLKVAASFDRDESFTKTIDGQIWCITPEYNSQGTNLAWNVSYINVFIKQMRPRLPAALSDGKQALFLSWFGNQIGSNQMTKDLSSIFKKAGIKGPVHHTLYRKSAVSQCHARHKEISSNLADLMAHREGTAEEYYRLFEKNKLDKESKFCMFTNFPRALVRRESRVGFFAIVIRFG